ncbi:MAG: ATP-binding protein [Clostridiaceae bacterium]
MFKRLKTKLILINMLLISAVLIFATCAVYLMTKRGISQQSDMLMHSIAKEEKLYIQENEPAGEDAELIRPQNNNMEDRILTGVFYAKIKPDGEILENSASAAYLRQNAGYAVKKAAEGKELSGCIRLNSLNLKYIKVQKNYGFIIVFFDTSLEDSILSRLMYTTIAIGIISLALIFFVSLYLAGKAIAPVKSSWEKQNAFAADASHELRTPLAIVNSNLEIVMENDENIVRSQSKWLGNIQQEIKRMSKLVEDLLFLARADMHEDETVMDQFNVSNSANQIIEVFKPLLDKKSLSLLSNIQANVVARGNEGRIKQLLTILIDNAFNHTQSGGRISLDLTKSGDFYEIVVSDTGEGIPEKEIDKIFERFYRVDKSRSRSYGGSGLGLSIAQCIVKEHRGSILVHSEVGKGTEFRIRLPIE